jgi:hypothetical protein
MMPFNANGAAWWKWRDIFNARIEEARVQMETPGLDAVATEGLRGQIVALRSLLELGTPAADTAGTEASVDYGLSRNTER